MKDLKAVCIIAALLLAGLLPAAKTETDGPWAMAYFRQRYETRIEIDAEGRTQAIPLPDPMREEYLHLALSEDGRNWTPLNGNRPVWNQWLRDPFIQRGPDGLWRLMATGGRGLPGGGDRSLGPVCQMAVSRDLVNWEQARALPLMKGVTDESGRPARNIWAPEWFYDKATGDTVLLWSSSFEDAGWKQSRLWYCRTRDWQTFTPAKVLFDPPYSVIDGTLLEHEGVYYLFHKEEEFGVKTGERRAIRLATSKHLEGPYEIIEGPLNDGQIVPTITEGPSVIPDPQKNGWLLLYDYCMTNDYGISASPDLVHWTVVDSITTPPDARHSSVFRLTPAEAKRLHKLYPPSEQKNPALPLKIIGL